MIGANEHLAGPDHPEGRRRSYEVQAMDKLNYTVYFLFIAFSHRACQVRSARTGS